MKDAPHSLTSIMAQTSADSEKAMLRFADYLVEQAQASARRSGSGVEVGATLAEPGPYLRHRQPSYRRGWRRHRLNRKRRCCGSPITWWNRRKRTPGAAASEDIDARAVLGSPAEEVVDYAKARNADLIICGSRGFGRLKSLLLGSTSQRLPS